MVENKFSFDYSEFYTFKINLCGKYNILDPTGKIVHYDLTEDEAKELTGDYNSSMFCLGKQR